MAEIELRNVSKRYGEVTAVNDASFTVKDGEFFILVGPSGCGKSTLLNMIVGLEDITTGEIRVDGRVINDLDPRERNMAMVFQSYAIYPHMTVRENMAFPLKLARLSAEEIARRVDAAAAILELTPLLDRRPHALSGGQRQRVAMGRAIVREPSVFLLDEPLSNLDAKLRGQMRAEIARLQQRLGTTTVYVTHDQTEALTLGDRIAMLRHGDIQQIGTPRELYERPANVFVAGFIGSPPMNFLPALGEEGRIRSPLGLSDPPSAAVGKAINGEALLIGFRPEHLEVAGPVTNADDRCGFTSEVVLLEWLGAELFVHFDIALGDIARQSLPADLGIDLGGDGEARLVARIDPGADLREGQRVSLGVKPQKLLVFSADSGDLLG